jgi:hypothetical protein
MSLSSALAHFVCPLLIFVLQLSYNDLHRTEIYKELHVALTGWRSPSRQISNYARFPAMTQASDSTKLHFSLFTELDIFDKTIGPLDLYQGSRLVAKWAEICTTHLRRAKKTLLLEAMNTPSDILANAQFSKDKMQRCESQRYLNLARKESPDVPNVFEP